jgi:hypothetical protein
VQARSRERRAGAVKRGLIGWLAASLASWLGWWLGSHLGFGAGIMLSVLAGAAGLYAGHRWFDDTLR